jgi:hypothetical protein
MKFKDFLTKKGYTDETFKALEADKQAQLHGEYLGELSASIEGKASQVDVDAVKAQIEALKTSSDLTTIKAAHDNLELEIAALKEGKFSKEDISTIKSVLEANKETIKSIVENGGKTTFDIELKAQHNPTDIGNRNQLGQFEQGISQIVHNNIFMQDVFPRGTASTEYIKYREQATVVRDAKNVAACATTEHNTKLTWNIRDLQMKKVRDITDVCIDMMEDYDFVETEIRTLVDTNLQLKKDADLLLGDGIGANINGVASYSATFSATSTGANYANTVENAQLIDLLVIAGAQIKAFGGQNFFRPNVIVLNPKDATLMGLLKDGESNYIKSGTVNAAVFRDQSGTLFINGMRVIENPNCPENQAYVFDSTKGLLYTRRGVVIEMAYENGTNFEAEVVTVKAYERMNLRVRNNDANAFMHIPDIAAAITAITAP